MLTGIEPCARQCHAALNCGGAGQAYRPGFQSDVAGITAGTHEALHPRTAGKIDLVGGQLNVAGSAVGQALGEHACSVKAHRIALQSQITCRVPGFTPTPKIGRAIHLQRARLER